MCEECARSVRGERSGLGRRIQENAGRVRRGCERTRRARGSRTAGLGGAGAGTGIPGCPRPGRRHLAPAGPHSLLPARVTVGARPARAGFPSVSVPARPGQGLPSCGCRELRSSAAARRGRDGRGAPRRDPGAPGCCPSAVGPGAGTEPLMHFPSERRAGMPEGLAVRC